MRVEVHECDETRRGDQPSLSVVLVEHDWRQDLALLGAEAKALLELRLSPGRTRDHRGCLRQEATPCGGQVAARRRDAQVRVAPDIDDEGPAERPGEALGDNALDGQLVGVEGRDRQLATLQIQQDPVSDLFEPRRMQDAEGRRAVPDREPVRPERKGDDAGSSADPVERIDDVAIACRAVHQPTDGRCLAPGQRVGEVTGQMNDNRFSHSAPGPARRGASLVAQAREPARHGVRPLAPSASTAERD